MTETTPAAVSDGTHEHRFTVIPVRFGSYGPQDVHYHPCIEGRPGDCDAVIAGVGRECDGRESPHERMELTEHGPQPAEALVWLRANAGTKRAYEPADAAPPVAAALDRDAVAAVLRKQLGAADFQAREVAGQICALMGGDSEEKPDA